MQWSLTEPLGLQHTIKILNSMGIQPYAFHCRHVNPLVHRAYLVYTSSVGFYQVESYSFFFSMLFGSTWMLIFPTFSFSLRLNSGLGQDLNVSWNWVTALSSAVRLAIIGSKCDKSNAVFSTAMDYSFTASINCSTTRWNPFMMTI